MPNFEPKRHTWIVRKLWVSVDVFIRSSVSWCARQLVFIAVHLQRHRRVPFCAPKKLLHFGRFFFFRTPVHVLQLFSCHVIDHSEMRAGCALVLLELSERSKRADKHVSCAPEYMYGLLTRHDAWRNLKVARACATILNAMSRSSGQKMEIAKATLLPCIHLLWTFRKKRTQEPTRSRVDIRLYMPYSHEEHGGILYLNIYGSDSTFIPVSCTVESWILCCAVLSILCCVHYMYSTKQAIRNERRCHEELLRLNKMILQ